LWEKAGKSMDTSLKYAGDFELWLRFMGYTKLYTLATILGGFRGRISNQLSKDHYPEYLEEARKAVKSLVFDTETKNTLIKIESQYKKLALMKRFKLDILSVKEKLVSLYDFPPRIILNQDKCALSDNNHDLFSFYPYEA
jgi:intein-encoded DNA endonuclease-like protein